MDEDSRWYKLIRGFDQLLQSTLTLVSVILFLISLTLIVFGLLVLIQSWDVLMGSNVVPTLIEGSFLTIVIEALGSIAIGIAVLDLTKSILDAELAERKTKDVQERARDFLTRFLAVIIFAIAAEVFIKIARSNVTETKILGDVALLGIAVGAMLIGLAVYLKLSLPEGKVKLRMA